EIVEAELLLDLLEELGRGIEEADPYEDAWLLEDVADVRDGHVADAPPIGIGDGGNHPRRGRTRGRRHRRQERKGPRRTDATSPPPPSARPRRPRTPRPPGPGSGSAHSRERERRR